MLAESEPRGESDVNESMITGESRPVRKDPGAKVVAGSINGDCEQIATGPPPESEGLLNERRE